MQLSYAYLKRELHGMKSQFNKTNAEVEFARYTWNPVTGCPHNCHYCYAKPIAESIYKEGFALTFRKERLQAPFNTPKPRNKTIWHKLVFVTSMGDLFAEAVPAQWIKAVLNVVYQTPQWIYLFLTKNPERLLDFKFTDNCWVGTTVDVQRRVETAQQVFRRLNAKVKFVCCEPLLQKVAFDTMQDINWMIIGAQTQTMTCPEIQPKWSWMASLLAQAHQYQIPIFWKENLTVRPKQLPVTIHSQQTLF